MLYFIVSKIYRIADAYEVNDVFISHILICQTICKKIRSIRVDFTVLCCKFSEFVLCMSHFIVSKVNRIVSVYEVNDVLISYILICRLFGIFLMSRWYTIYCLESDTTKSTTQQRW